MLQQPLPLRKPFPSTARKTSLLQDVDSSICVPVCRSSLEIERHLFYLHFLPGTAPLAPTPLATTSPTRPSQRTPATPAATTLLLPPPLLLLLSWYHGALVCCWYHR
jgi:hypothetical protein